MRALVIDDSKAIRSILGKMLRELGFEVFQAGDGREALERLKTTGPMELALIDWNMPVMDGLELIRAIRVDSKYNNMRLMMVTTETEMSRVVKALEAGANEYVMKPFTKDIIVNKLHLMGIAVS